MAAVLLAVALLHCKADPPQNLDVDISLAQSDARPLSADQEPASPDRPPAADLGGCSQQTIPLEVLGSGPDLQFYMAVTYQGQPAMMMLDTGSALNFVFLGAGGPRYRPGYAKVQIGCEEVTVDGRGLDNHIPDVGGKQVVGLLGVAFLLEKPSLLSFAAKTLTRHAKASPPPRTGWTEVPFDDVQGQIIASVVLDQSPLRLMVDTGAPHVVWLGAPAQPSDTPHQVQDATGALLTFYVGKGELQLGKEAARIVVVEHAPSWPYFENTVKLLGGNIHGLFGLSAWGGRSLLFGAAAKTLFLAPPL